MARTETIVGETARPTSVAPRVVVLGGPRIVCESLAAGLAGHGIPAAVPPDGAETLPSGDGIVGLVVAWTGTASRAADATARLTAAGTPLVALVDPKDPAGLAECVSAGAESLVPWTISLGELAGFVRAVAGGRAPTSPIDPTAAGTGFADDLTRREREILRDLIAGHRAAAIARRSFVSLNTVRSQIRTMLRKLGVHSQLEAVALARRAGWSGDRP